MAEDPAANKGKASLGAPASTSAPPAKDSPTWIQRQVAFLAKFGGILAGVGLLSFAAGFLVLRAQYELAGVPFVYIDYWYFVETGLMTLLRSIQLLFHGGWALFVMTVISVGVVFGLRWSAFRTWLKKPRRILIANLVLLVLVIMTIRQQYAVRELPRTLARLAAAPTTSIVEPDTIPGNLPYGWAVEHVRKPDLSHIHGPDTVPERWPFSWFVRDRVVPELLSEDVIATNSVAVWRALADEIELELYQPQRIELRPRPLWALRIQCEDDEDRCQALAFLGQSVSDEELDKTRALDLYKALLSLTLLSAWGWYMIRRWLHYTEPSAGEEAPSVGQDTPATDQNTPPAQPTGQNIQSMERRAALWETLWHRSSTHLWDVSRYVLHPLALVGLVVILVLMPQSYGMLVMNEVAQERVEIALKQDTQRDAPAPSGPTSGPTEEEQAPSQEASDPNVSPKFERSPGQTWQRDVDALEREASPVTRNQRIDNIRAFLRNYTENTGQTRLDLRQTWQRDVDALERAASRAALLELGDRAALALMYDEELADYARRAWARRSRFQSKKIGFILHYPRSEIDYLRTVGQSPETGEWSIQPAIKASDIEVISVEKDNLSRQLVRVLRELPSLQTLKHAQALTRVPLFRHPRTFEVIMATSLDPNPLLAGPTVTDLGYMTTALPATPIGHLRRQRAIELFLHLARDPDLALDHRGAAVTALAKGAVPGDARTCNRLQQILFEEPDERDRVWEFRGIILSTFGQLRCRDSLPILLALLEPEKETRDSSRIDQLLEAFEDKPTNVIQEIRAAIPTAILFLEEPEQSVPALIRILDEPGLHPRIAGAAVSALGLLGGEPELRERSVAALTRYLTRTRDTTLDSALDPIGKAFYKSNRVRALTSLIMLAHRSSLRAFRTLAEDKSMSSEERAIALLGVQSLDNPEDEDWLLDIARDQQDELQVRLAAINALGGLATSEGAAGLYKLGLDEASNHLLVQAVITALEARAEEGNATAADYAQRLKDPMEGLDLSGLPSVPSPPGRILEFESNEQAARWMLQNSDKHMVIAIYPPDCDTCAQQTGELERLAQERPDDIAIAIARIDKLPAFAELFEEGGVLPAKPAFVLVVDGMPQEPLLQGPLDKDALDQAVDQARGVISP